MDLGVCLNFVDKLQKSYLGLTICNVFWEKGQYFQKFKINKNARM